MTIIKTNTKADLGGQVKTWRKQGLKIGLVPTMGALHAGHLSLVTEILKHAQRVVVSIFVNPAQFSPAEDFDSYPREEDKDCAKLVRAGAHLVYLPDVSEIFGDQAEAEIQAGPLGDPLCGRFRPGHFDGVATVVTNLLHQCQPDVAIFGEKDFQQLRVIETLAVDLSTPVEILGGPIIREDDGLAMSSRNAYLSADQRVIAATLSKTMQGLIARANAGEDLGNLENDGRDALLLAGFDAVDYLEFCQADDLSHSQKISAKTRLFAAGHIGKTRLIDNMPLN